MAEITGRGWGEGSPALQYAISVKKTEIYYKLN